MESAGLTVFFLFGAEASRFTLTFLEVVARLDSVLSSTTSVLSRRGFLVSRRGATVTVSSPVPTLAGRGRLGGRSGKDVSSTSSSFLTVTSVTDELNRLVVSTSRRELCRRFARAAAMMVKFSYVKAAGFGFQIRGLCSHDR